MSGFVLFHCNCNVINFLATMLQTGFSEIRDVARRLLNFPLNRGLLFFRCILPIGSMYGRFTYIYHKNQPNVGIYTIHGSYGLYLKMAWMSYQGLCGRCAIVQATSKGETRPILGGRRVETTTFGVNWICCDQTLYAIM